MKNCTLEGQNMYGRIELSRRNHFPFSIQPPPPLPTTSTPYALLLAGRETACNAHMNWTALCTRNKIMAAGKVKMMY